MSRLTHYLIVASSLVCLSMAARADDASVCPRNDSPDATGMPSTARIFKWDQDLAALGYRRTGTLADEQAAAYVKCQFESLGLQDVHYETATSWKWEATKSGLSVNGQSIDSFPVAFSFLTPNKPSAFATPPGGLNAEIVDLHNGTALDFALNNVKGKIVVFDLRFLISTADFLPLIEFLWDPKLTILDPTTFAANPYETSIASVVTRVMNAGAVGFVGVLADYIDSNKYYNEYYSYLQPKIPGLWVTKKDGATIRALMKSGGRPTATIVMEGSRTEALARAVVGVLPGKSLDTILVTSHHDSVWNGAVEDGSGTASVLAQAQYFASKPQAARNKTMMFATMDSHFTGYQVHQAFANKYIVNKQTPYKIVADVTLEHIAKQGVNQNGTLVINDQPELRGIFENFSAPLSNALKQSIINHDLRRTAMLNSSLLCSTVGIPTDAFACLAGVPTASLISGPVYLYDQADATDKVAQDQLVPVAQTFADFIEAIDRTPSAMIAR